MTELRFECTMCGACCRRPGVIAIGADEISEIAQALGRADQEFIDQHALEPQDDGGFWLRLGGAPCPLLVDDRCSVHAVKPRQCRAYPFWPEIVETFEAWAAEREHCPGIGSGDVWSDGEVQAMLELVDV